MYEYVKTTMFNLSMDRHLPKNFICLKRGSETRESSQFIDVIKKQNQ